MDLSEIEKCLKYSDKILSLFIVGYFGLYVVYGNVFLGYDVITRIVLSIAASLLLFIPVGLGAAILKIKPDSPDSGEYIFGHGYFIIFLFTFVEFFNYDTILQREPRFYTGLIIVITLFDLTQALLISRKRPEIV